MGVATNVGFSKFPAQGPWVGMRCEVCFDYDPNNRIGAVCVRNDREDPGRCIFRLDDGRHVLSTECQHTMPTAAPPPDESVGELLARLGIKPPSSELKAACERIAAEPLDPIPVPLLPKKPTCDEIPRCMGLDGSTLRIVPAYTEAGINAEANCVTITDGERTVVYVPYAVARSKAATP